MAQDNTFGLFIPGIGKQLCTARWLWRQLWPGTWLQRSTCS